MAVVELTGGCTAVRASCVHLHCCCFSVLSACKLMRMDAAAHVALRSHAALAQAPSAVANFQLLSYLYFLYFPCRAMSQLAEAEEEDHGWEVDEEDADKDELCNCRFSLAYGGKILLNNATLRLIRGRRYGLCGGNGVGKSTLMKAIARGQLDGFPPADELKTVYVEHDIQVRGNYKL